MENPFQILEERLASIERKLEELTNEIKDPNSTSPAWMTTKQVAAHLGVSPTTVTNMRISKLPYYKLGGKILFKKQEIDEWVEKTRHKSGSEYLDEYLNKF